MRKVENKEEFCRKLGYHNSKLCLEKLEYFEKNGVEKYLRHNFKYDFILGSELFLKKVLEVYGDEEDIRIFEKTRERLSKKPGHLFVNTNFRRKNEPVFVLAFCEGVRNISIDRREFKNREEELEYVKKFVKNHYRKNEKKISIWGEIENYFYKSDSFDKYLILDKEGDIIEEKKDFFIPNRAILAI